MNFKAARQRFAALDPTMQLPVQLGGGAIGIAGLISLLDLYLGDKNQFNSNEYLVNSLHSASPILGFAAGGMAGLNTYDKKVAEMDAEDAYKKDIAKAKEGLKGRTYNSEEERVKAQTDFANAKNAAEDRRRFVTDEYGGMSRAQMRRGLRGGAIGALSAAVPASLGMILDDQYYANR